MQQANRHFVGVYGNIAYALVEVLRGARSSRETHLRAHGLGEINLQYAVEF